MKTTTSDVGFNHKAKDEIRDAVLASSIRSRDLVDFFGPEGIMYKKVAEYNKRAQQHKQIKITSIDFAKSPKIRQEMWKTFQSLPGTMITEYKKLCSQRVVQVGTIWTDYCGNVGPSLFRDMRASYKIMKDEGDIYVTVLRAREKIYRGLSRQIKDKKTVAAIIRNLRNKGKGVNATLIASWSYTSRPTHDGEESRRSSPMITYKLTWKK